MRRLSLLFLAALCALGASAVATPAVAAGGPWDRGGDDGGWRAQASSVTITVGGARGRHFKNPAPYTPPPPCYYVAIGSADEIKPQHALWIPFTPLKLDWWLTGIDPATGLPPDIEQRRGKPGEYYMGTCSIDRWPKDNDDWSYFGYVIEWYQKHPTRFFTPDEALPREPVPPRLLVRYAEEHLRPPKPEVELNPAARSLVALPTWVWADETTFGPLTVTAQSGPNWARIDAHATHMKLSAPSAARATQQGSCRTGGTRYTPGATTDCAITFGRSSAIASGGTWPLQVTSFWEARGSTSDGSVATLDPISPPSTSVPVPVAEAQALVR